MNTMREKQVEEAVLRMDTMYGELDSLLFRREVRRGMGDVSGRSGGWLRHELHDQLRGVR